MTRAQRVALFRAVPAACLASLLLGGRASVVVAAEEADDVALVRDIEASFCPASDDPLGTIHPARLRAIDGLGERGRRALLAMVTSRAANRTCALEYLVGLGERRAIAPLRALADDATAATPIRGRSLRGLAALDDRESIERAVRWLASGDRMLFRSSVEALVAFGGDDARAALRASLATGVYPTGYQRLLVAKIGELRDADAVPLLVALAAATDDTKRVELTRALAAIGTPESVAAAADVCKAIDAPALRGLVARELARAVRTAPGTTGKAAEAIDAPTARPDVNCATGKNP